jgi:hypothetical protein
MNFEGQPLKSWCFHLHYMDPHTLAVICFGGIDGGKEASDRKLDIEKFSQSTQLLGTAEPLRNYTTKKDIFYQVKYQDIEKTISDNS